MESSKFHTSGGGSLLIAWQLKDKKVLIVGGGGEASRRVESILTTDAHITIVSPANGLHPRIKDFIKGYGDRITHHDRVFAGPQELEDMDMVLTALDDVDLSREICQLCRKARIPVNAADIPDSCDFFFGSQIRDGPLQIMISTNGNGPKMANLIKGKLESALTGIEGQAILKVGELRARLKTRAPGVGGEIGGKRMKWMTKFCDTWKLEELVMLDDAMMEKVLDDGWENDWVPTFEQLNGRGHPGTSSVQLPDTIVTWPSALGFAAGAICTMLVVMSRRR